MADLETMYGEDAAQALYMWRFAGVSFGLEARFWWTLLGSLATVWKPQFAEPHPHAPSADDWALQNAGGLFMLVEACHHGSH